MSIHIDRAPDATYIAYGESPFMGVTTEWTDLPGARVEQKLGKGQVAYGAIYVATFSAEALAQSPVNNGVLSATVFFGSNQGEPDSTNHRFATAGGGGEWNSHTFIRHFHFDHDIHVRDVSAQVRLKGAGLNNTGVQNWVLKLERYNL
jgi:hypothetical protein